MDTTNRAENPTPIRPWERQDGESETVSGYFAAYMGQPRPRSLERLATTLGLSYQYIRDLSSEWRWADRVAAWDAEVDRVEADVTLEEVARRRRQYLEALDLAIDVGSTRLRAVKDGKTGDPEGGDFVAPGVARQLIVESIKVAQLLLGQATERVERTGEASAGADLDWDALSEEEIWQLRALLAKARKD